MDINVLSQVEWIHTFSGWCTIQSFRGWTHPSLLNLESQLHASDRLEGVNLGSSAPKTCKLCVIGTPVYSQQWLMLVVGPFGPWPEPSPLLAWLGLVMGWSWAGQGLVMGWCVYMYELDQTWIRSLRSPFFLTCHQSAILPHHSSVFQTAGDMQQNVNHARGSWDSLLVWAWDSRSKGCEFESRQGWWKNFLLHSQLCVLTLILCPFHPCVTAVACKRPRSFCKNAGGRLHLNTHTPLTHWSQSGLTMLLSRQSVEIYQETSSHATH